MICVKFTAFCDLRIRLATHRKSVRKFWFCKRESVWPGLYVEKVCLYTEYYYIYWLFIFSTDTGLAALCNEKCVCPIEAMNPVCGTDQLTYFSPCHAGCRSFSGGVMSLFLCLVLVNPLWSFEDTSLFRHYIYPCKCKSYELQVYVKMYCAKVWVIYLSIHPSIHPSIYLSIYLSLAPTKG